MKLTNEQIKEIKDQQLQENKTKRVTVSELEKISTISSTIMSWPRGTNKCLNSQSIINFQIIKKAGDFYSPTS